MYFLIIKLKFLFNENFANFLFILLKFIFFIFFYLLFIKKNFEHLLNFYLYLTKFINFILVNFIFHYIKIQIQMFFILINYFHLKFFPNF